MDREALQHRQQTPQEEGAKGSETRGPRHSRLAGLAAELNGAPPVQRLTAIGAQSLLAPSAAQPAVIQAKVFSGDEELETYAAIRDALVREYGANASSLNHTIISRYQKSSERHELAALAAELGLHRVDRASELPAASGGGGSLSGMSAAPKGTPAGSSLPQTMVGAWGDHPPVAGGSASGDGVMSGVAHGRGVASAAVAASSSSVAGRGASRWNPEEQGERAPPEAQLLMRQFAEGGVLISTLQSADLGGGPKGDLAMAVRHNILPGAGVREEGGGLVQDLSGLSREQKAHPTLNWSVAHQELVPSYYGMTEGGEGAVRPRGGTARTVGLLADPYSIGDKFRSNSPGGLSFGKDAASSNTAGSGGAPIYTQAEAVPEYERLRDTEIAAQRAKPGKAMETTEIKTLGFGPHAIAGFMATHIDADRPVIQQAVDAMPPGSREHFPVFTWEMIDGATQLRFVEMISKRPPEAGEGGKAAEENSDG